MPHIIIKLIEGRTDAQKQAVAEAVAEAVQRTLGAYESSISVGIEEVPHEDWAEKVYRPDILGKQDTIYQRPGYEPFA